MPRPPPTSDQGAQRLRQNLPADSDVVDEPSGPGAPQAVTTPGAAPVATSGAAPAPSGGPPRPPPPRRPPSGTRPAAAAPPEASTTTETAAESASAGDFDELEDWRRVFEEFLAMKRQCNEDTSALSFDKFKGTLQRNKDALVARQGCSRVKFTVYAKEGRAALKASPVK